MDKGHFANGISAGVIDKPLLGIGHDLAQIDAIRLRYMFDPAWGSSWSSCVDSCGHDGLLMVIREVR